MDLGFEVRIFLFRATHLGPEKFMQWLSYRLPRKLVYFAAIRLIAYATSGKYGSTSPGDIGAIECLTRWEDGN